MTIRWHKKVNGNTCGKWREVIDVGGNASEDGSHANKGVEGSHKLGQVSDLDPEKKPSYVGKIREAPFG